MGQITPAIYNEGEIVEVPFPFSDLSQSKNRPVIIIKTLSNDDFLVAMISTKGGSDCHKMFLGRGLSNNLNLSVESKVRYSRLFVVHQSKIKNSVGNVPKEFLESLKEKMARFIQS